VGVDAEGAAADLQSMRSRHPLTSAKMRFFQRLLVTNLVQKSEHQHLAGLRVLHNARDQPIHLGKIDRYLIHTRSLFSLFDCRRRLA
jgi:hypothetical protein